MTTSFGSGIPIQDLPPGLPPYTHAELHITTAGQHVIRLQGSYRPLGNDIIVYVNGVAVASEDYTEVDAKTLDFKDFLGDNDIVCILYQTQPPSQFVTPQRYTASKYLLENQQYTLDVNLGDPKEFKFTSRYTPLYSNAKVIRSDLGEWVGDLTDDMINFAVYEASKMLTDMVDEIEEPVPAYVKHYIRYKTEIDLITAIYLSEVKRGSRISKKLGDMTIDREAYPPKINDLIAEIQRKMRPWQARVFGEGEVVAVTGAVKANTNYAYPLTDRRSF